MVKCKFRIPEDGKRVIWEITNKCNYNCVYCIFGCGNTTKKELSSEDCKRVVDELIDEGYNHFKITGGEPFLRKDILEILKHIENKGVKLDISTNASLLTKEIVKELSKIKLDFVHVGLDAHNDSLHSLIRGKGTFEKTSSGVKLLKENGIYVRVGTVICKSNQGYLNEIVEYASNLGVDEIVFSFVELAGRLNNKGFLSTIKDTEIDKSKYKRIKIKDNISSIEYEVEKCPGGKKFIFIDSEGKVAKCTWALETKSKLSLKESSLKNIIEKGNF